MAPSAASGSCVTLIVTVTIGLSLDKSARIGRIGPNNKRPLPAHGAESWPWGDPGVLSGGSMGRPFNRSLDEQGLSRPAISISVRTKGISPFSRGVRISEVYLWSASTGLL